MDSGITADTRPFPIAGVGPGGGPNTPHMDPKSTGSVVEAVSFSVDSSLLFSVFAFDPSFTGGVRVGFAARTSGPGLVVTGADPGGGPNVRA